MTQTIVRLALVLCGLSLIALALTRFADGQRGDAERGAALYGSGRLSCTACHLDEFSAPLMPGLANRVAVVRLAANENANETVALYLAESIIDPNRYVVPGYPASNMPHYAIASEFGLSWQDLKDLVAYLMTL